MLLDDLRACAVASVFSAGRPVDEALFAARPALAPIGRGSVKATPAIAADFPAPGSGPSTRVIGVVPGKIITAVAADDPALPRRPSAGSISIRMP